MTIGFDVSRDSINRNKSYGSLVATMDLKHGAMFYSTVSTFTDSTKMSTEFGLSVLKALRTYKEHHGTLPVRIIIYRGGVGDGDIQHVRDVEVKTVENSLNDVYKKRGIELKLAFIIVTKNTNSRFFAGQNNPSPGTVVDTVVTLPER